MNNQINFKNGKNMKTFKTLFLAIAILASYSINAQVAVTTDGSSADGSAMLDVVSTDKGMLIPRVALTMTTDAAPISSPVESLMVYNTATAGDVTPGFYYWSDTAWATISTGTHYVGELYGGGVVFWVDNTGEHGLICSMVDISTSQAWSDVTGESVPGGALSDWDGQTNSTNIIAQSTSTSAAKICEDYTNEEYQTGEYSDWYLPSRGELNDLWNNLKAVQKALDSDGNGNTTALIKNYYWSSSESSNSHAWTFGFYYGYTNNLNKDGTTWVRAVRAF